MAVYKKEYCPVCKASKDRPQEKEPIDCPKCGTKMVYSPNWYISYTLYGKKYRESVSPRKREAEAKLGGIKLDIIEKRHFNRAPSVPWAVAVKRFRKWCETNVEPSTRRMYKTWLDALKPYFERYTLDQITVSMVEEYKAMRSIDVKPATINRAVATIKRLFALAEEWGLIETNHIRKVKLLKENNARVRFLSEKEMERLLQNCKATYLRLIVLIALNTGLRKNDILTLRWDEVDFERKIITKHGAKGGKSLYIPLSASLESALRAYRSETKVLAPYIVTSPKRPGQPIQDPKKAFSTALTNASIHDFKFHDLRHTFASHFLMRTGDLKTLQEILGHSDLKMTMRYAHLLDEHKQKAMKVFEAGNPFATKQ